MRLFRCAKCGLETEVGDAAKVRCSCGTVYVGDHFEAQCKAIGNPQPKKIRPGDALRSVISKLGYSAKSGCGCDDRVAEMNRKGLQWCVDNRDEIVGWLKESASQRLAPAAVMRLAPSVAEKIINQIVDEAFKMCGYIESDQIAIITTHFNPAGFQRLRDTYRQWIKTMPPGVVTIELAGSDADVPEAIHLYGGHDAILWQKERLINYALTLLKPSVRFVAWIDHDLIFQRGDWAQAGVEAILSGLDCVQLFDRVDYLDREGNAVSHQPGAVAQIQAGRGPSGAPGGAWMASREWIELIGGLYDRNIAGGGDATFLEAVTGAATAFSERQAPRLREDCQRYRERVGGVKFGHIAGAVKHLWHGDRSNRQYISRDEILCRWDFDPQTMIQHEDGPWRWTEAAPAGLRIEIANYFANRREDG